MFSGRESDAKRMRLHFLPAPDPFRDGGRCYAHGRPRPTGLPGELYEGWFSRPVRPSASVGRGSA
jgi:hypothetical protein